MALSIETWKDIEGYRGHYQVSDLGRVRGVDREVSCSNGKIRRVKGKVLKLSYCTQGYLGVSLYTVGVKASRKSVHRLVISAFIGEGEISQVVNHKNGVKDDNRSINLEWCTQSDNVQHAHNTGLIDVKRGELSAGAKLTNFQVLEICDLLDTGGITQKEIASRYGIHETSVTAINKGTKWNHLTNRLGTIRPYKGNKGSNNYKSRQVINCRGQIFSTITQASIEFEIKHTSSISLACRSEYSYAGNYPDTGEPIKWNYLSNKEMT